MSSRLKAAAAAEGIVFATALVGYLTLIAAALRDVNRTLRLITVGVRAIEQQAEPLAAQIEDINRSLERAVALLRETAEPSARS